jgi:Plavaka transposase
LSVKFYILKNLILFTVASGESPMPRTIKPRNVPCTFNGCHQLFTNRAGLSNHLRMHHVPNRRKEDSFLANIRTSLSPLPEPLNVDTPFFNEFEPVQPPNDLPGTHRQREIVELHPFLNGASVIVDTSVVSLIKLTGLPCDSEGNFLPQGLPPPSWDYPPPDDLSPFETRPQFDLADLLFRKNQMSGSDINELLQIWTATVPPEDDPPFINKDHLYSTIDAIDLGEVPWNFFSVSFNGDIPEGDTATWKRSDFHVYFRDPHTVLRNQLGNPDFATEMDTAPKEVRDENGTRRYTDLMSGDWSWRQAVYFIQFYVLPSIVTISLFQG